MIKIFCVTVTFALIRGLYGPADGTLNCDKGFRLEFDSLCKQIVYFLITFNCLFPLDYKYIGYSC